MLVHGENHSVLNQSINHPAYLMRREPKLSWNEGNCLDFFGVLFQRDRTVTKISCKRFRFWKNTTSDRRQWSWCCLTTPLTISLGFTVFCACHMDTLCWSVLAAAGNRAYVVWPRSLPNARYLHSTTELLPTLSMNFYSSSPNSPKPSMPKTLKTWIEQAFAICGPLSCLTEQC